MMIVIIQLVSAVLIFITLIGSVLVPYCVLVQNSWRNRNGRSLALSLSNCIACGIFLSTCFLGLIPHVRHQEMQLRAGNDSLSVESRSGGRLIIGTEALVLLGFLLIMVIEQLLVLCSPDPHNAKASPKKTPTLRTLLESDNEDGQPLVDTTLDEDGMQDIIFRTNSPAAEHDHASHSHMVNMENGLSASTFFLLLGLSIHSLFEGVALGVQGEHRDFFNVLLAVMFHEVLCCIAYGVSLAQQRTPVRSAITTAIILSASIPFGMVCAVMVDQFESGNSQMLRFVLEGLAAGTFVYVACVEMLSSELSGGHGHGHSHEHDASAAGETVQKRSLHKVLAVCAGVFVFWGLQLALGSHSS